MITANRQVGFTVRDITTRVENLSCWYAGCDETALLAEAEAEGYTYFPVREDGVVAGVLSVAALRDGQRRVEALTSRWLIAADTPVLHLIDLFAAEPDRHYFVLSSSEIIGMVTPADLNKVPARASFYLLTAQFETLLTQFIKTFTGSSETDLQPYLSEGRIERAKDVRARERESNLELPLLHYVQLFDLVEVVAKSEELSSLLGFESATQVRDTLKFGDVRNPVAHLNNLLIAATEDITRVNEDCKHIIVYSQRIQEALDVANRPTR